MLISLVICTYNRANILKATLPSVYSLIIPDGVDFELIIIDNNSTDDTSNFVNSVIASNEETFKSRYVFEPEQGLSFARNSGYLNAKGDYIVYTDDECILPKEWLVKAIENIKERQPAFLGGPYFGKYLPGSSSNWYKEKFGDSYILQYGLPNGPLLNRYLSGGNLFIRRDVFEKIGLFDVYLGMNGETISYGEEVDFQKRFIEKYPDEIIWYDETVFVWHCIRDEKMKISFLFKDALIRGASSAELQKNTNNNTFLKAPFHFIYFIAKAIYSSIRKFLSSLFKKEHYFASLYEDYKNGTWRDIGGAWYRMKQLFDKA